MLGEITNFLFDWEKFLNFKFNKLMTILNERGTISYEEWGAFEIIHTLRKFPKKHEEVHLERIAEVYRERIPNVEDRKIITKVLYQVGFFEEAKRKYYNYILPFIEKAKWTYFLKPKLYRRKNAN